MEARVSTEETVQVQGLMDRSGLVCLSQVGDLGELTRGP